jgi:hypothetical protein
MKITKSLFKTSIEITGDEIYNLRNVLLPTQYKKFIGWLKRVFGLDINP